MEHFEGLGFESFFRMASWDQDFGSTTNIWITQGNGYSPPIVEQ